MFLMSLSELLHKPYFEVASWPPEEHLRWKAWGIIQREDREKAKQDAEDNAGRRHR